MAKSSKIKDSWHVTPCSIPYFLTIQNLYRVRSNSVILLVKTTSNRVFAVKNDKILQDQGVMACDLLFDSEFTDDSESEINFMTTYVKKNRPQKVQKSQNPIFDMSHIGLIMTCSLFDSKFLLLQSVRIISIS